MEVLLCKKRASIHKLMKYYLYMKIPLKQTSQIYYTLKEEIKFTSNNQKKSVPVDIPAFKQL